MKIAVDTRKIIGNNHREEYGYFLFETLKALTQKNPQHEFIFIFDQPYYTGDLFNKNVITVAAGPGVTNLFFKKIWYDVKIPAVLRKHKADLFIASNGICSLTTKTPQCLIISDLSFLYTPSFIKKPHLFFLKRYTSKFLGKANSIVTTSAFIKNEIISRYAIDGDKITVVPGTPPGSFHHLTDDIKNEVKQQYTGGKNYFIYTGAIHPRNNIINLLKAFSVFKRLQKSDWKLVLAGKRVAGYKNFPETLKAYKYREDVVMTGYVGHQELNRLTGSAYAFIYPSFTEGCGIQITAPMKCHIPVIVSGNSAMQEIAGDAALYIEPADHKDIADKMMRLYKDEPLRNSLVEKGIRVAAKYNPEKMAELFWQSILKAIE